MKGSVTYQAIIQEGEARGKARGELDGKRALLLLIGGKKFGTPTSAARKAIQAISDSQKLESLALLVSDVSSWRELLASAR